MFQFKGDGNISFVYRNVELVGYEIQESVSHPHSRGPSLENGTPLEQIQ